MTKPTFQKKEYIIPVRTREKGAPLTTVKKRIKKEKKDNEELNLMTTEELQLEKEAAEALLKGE